ncbi:MAG: flagellar hook-basal body protein [Planctomycetota bacterium]|nr:flagellar hook-basal body protein [Planctomycetota bacterium]
MNYGLYLSAAGVITNLHRQDVLANNLANVNTVGFKPDTVYTRQRLPERQEAALPIEPHWLLEQLGGGQAANPTYLSLRQGNLLETGNDLDLAIDGDGFLVVRTTSGTGNESIRLTRDGRLTLNANGELILAATGMRVLDVNDQPIRLDGAAKVEIKSTGEVIQDGQVRATIQITSPADPTRLTKVGDNLLRLSSSGPIERAPAGGRLVQGHLEASAVDPIMALNAMISATKAAQGNIKMMQYHDHLMGQAVNTLGRVA